MSVTPLASQTPSLVLAPSVAAHRGASGSRPEHTLDAYRTAVRVGADEIELDLVITADGVLVARHDAELSATTDVARHPEFAARRTTKVVDGATMSGWFVEDFTLAELKRLAARERFPRLRPANTTHDGAEGVPTFSEVLAMVGAESVRRGRPVGVLVELKHAARFAALGLEVVTPLLADLARHGLDHAWSRVSVMSFETTVLREVASRSALPVVQLLGAGRGGPPDLVADDTRGWAELCTPEGLARIDEYADGVGPHRNRVLPRDTAGRIGRPSTLVDDAHRLGLTVHVWTLRAENRFLPTNLQVGTDPRAHGDLAGEVSAFLAAGVDTVITDHPEVAVGVLGGA
ncbi:MAG: glycerophosphodiester phosphodiesterase family protein [Nocardioides sp.]|uniref:glycerophosphodiester phosphodiesterase family protein n=1 Tax=Nocardioides sp. TaxID=35761 RepID=UPI003F038A32